MLYEYMSDAWQELYGHLDSTWHSELPPHQTFIDALVDPSLWPASLGEGDGFPNILHAQGIRDVHQGVQFMLKHLTTQVEGVVDSIASTGVLSDLTSAIKDAAVPQAIAASIPEDLVVSTLTNTDSNGGKVASALFAAGLTALSAAGPLGMAASAIIGTAAAIATAVKRAKDLKADTIAERRRKVYLLMPPLQQPGSENDEWYAKAKIFPIMELGRWTSLFAPRFNPRDDWVGAPRNGGYAFAPGGLVR